MALLISLASFVLTVQGSENFLVSARADTGRGARADLADANNRLLGRGLPLFEVPGPDAPNYIIQRQSGRAWSRVDYPESWAREIREEVRAGRRPSVEPVASLDRDLVPRGDEVVTVTPISPDDLPSSTAPTRTGSAPTGPAPAPPPAPGPAAPVAPPASQQRGLLPLLPDLPVRVPLLSE